MWGMRCVLRCEVCVRMCDLCLIMSVLWCGVCTVVWGVCFLCVCDGVCFLVWGVCYAMGSVCAMACSVVYGYGVGYMCVGGGGRGGR